VLVPVPVPVLLFTQTPFVHIWLAVQAIPQLPQ
jgi:hypothetical protein